MGGNNVIEVKNLVKRYGTHLAVDHLSFTVEKGQILGFLGPNGAGKSTTMNMLTGYISATEGTILINGYDMLEEPEEAKRCIGYLPEQPPVYQDMTVKEYLEFVAELKCVPKKERAEQIAYVMQQTMLVDVQKRLIKHLSKGYKQRVGIAQAIMGNPEVIILDEPTVGLDPAQIIEIRDLMKSLAKEHTVILSSHILSEISAVCDSVLIINKGKLVLRENPEELAKYMDGRGSLHIVVKGDKAVFLETLTKLEGVNSITELEVEGGYSAAYVYVEAEHDIREALFFALAEANLPLMELTKKVYSLEDIFLEVTKETDKAGETTNAENSNALELELQKEVQMMVGEQENPALSENRETTEQGNLL